MPIFNTVYGGGGSSSDVYLSAISDLTAKKGNAQATITWTDPSDVVISGYTLATWNRTILVRKTGSAPTSSSDGTVVLTETTRDTYSSTGYTDTGLTNDVTYYYAAFAVASNGNETISNIATATPKAYQKMILYIDESVSDPSSAVTYGGDATSMTAGSTDRDEFFGYYPCLLDASGNETVVSHSLTNNYVDWTEDEDGNDISSYITGSSGTYNCMIAFPRMGVQMSKSGTVITVKLTDDPDAYSDGYHYLAHTDGAVNLDSLDSQTDEQDTNKRKDTLYIGAYKGYITNSQLRSISGVTPTVSTTRADFRTAGTTMGSGYSQRGRYSVPYIQILYLFKYKSLNGQTALGRGYCDKTSSGSAVTTGLTNSHNMLNYGLTTSGTDTTNNRVVLFGIEDIWGNIWEWIDGFNLLSYVGYACTNRSSRADDTSTNYYNIGTATSTSGAYVTQTLGTTIGGFLPTANSGGSDSTYYSDYYWTANSNRVLIAGGYWTYESKVGPFSLYSNYTSSDATARVGGRLMFL